MSSEVLIHQTNMFKKKLRDIHHLSTFEKINGNNLKKGLREREMERE